MAASTNMLEALRLYQWVKEAAHGTDLAAVAKVACKGIDFVSSDDIVERPQLDMGVVGMYPGNESVVQRGTRITVPAFPFNFEQAPQWFGMIYSGIPAPTGVGPYVYAFSVPVSADPGVDSRTFERRLTDGSNNLDYAWHYAMMDSMTLKWTGNPGSLLTAEFSGFARRRQTEAMTAAQAFPTVEEIPSENVQIAIDSAWGSLGGTVIAGQIIDGEYKYANGMFPFFANDARADLDFSKHGFDPRKLGATLKFKLLVRNAAQYAAELTAAEAQSIRAVRISIAGTSGRVMTIDGLYKHEHGSLEKLDSWNGQDLVQISLVQTTDFSNIAAASVTNNSATAP